MALPTKTDLLRLDFTHLGRPFCDVEAKTLNTSRLDFTYLGQPFVGAPATTSLIPRRALYWNGNCVAEISNALLGTGKKPIVLMLDGTLRERVASEGTPLILVNSKRMLLNTSTETLLV